MFDGSRRHLSTRALAFLYSSSISLRVPSRSTSPAKFTRRTVGTPLTANFDFRYLKGLVPLGLSPLDVGVVVGHIGPVGQLGERLVLLVRVAVQRDPDEVEEGVSLDRVVEGLQTAFREGGGKLP